MQNNFNCRVCNQSDFDEVLDLGNQPWGNNFLSKSELGSEELYPLKLIRCKSCSLAQLDYTVSKEVMFSNHTYTSGTTESLNMHFKLTSEYVNSTFFSNLENKNILDIGSNDGSQLLHYKNLGFDVLGIESANNLSDIANKNGIPTLNKFFNYEVALDIKDKFDLINASGVFFHLEELHSVCMGIKKLLKSTGVFVVQFIYIKNMQEKTAFDQIYHEHLLYYSIETLTNLLNMHKLDLFDAYESKIHGGSIVGFVTHLGTKTKSTRLTQLIHYESENKVNDLTTYMQFSKNVIHLKNNCLNWISSLSSKNKLIYGLGAPVKGNTLLNYLKISEKEFKYLIERNPLRKGLFSPGTHIPIKLESEVVLKPDAYFVLAWNFKDEILRRYRNDLDKGIEFYFPVETA